MEDKRMAAEDPAAGSVDERIEKEIMSLAASQRAQPNA
jgi:hypothetical protein